MEMQEEADLCKKVSILEEKELSNVVDSRVALGPGTPNADRENGEAVLNSLSPFSFVSSSSLLVCSEAPDLDSSPRTPKGDVFDPFAPGPDELMLAPNVKKHAEETQNNVSRRLNFSSSLGFQEIAVKDDDNDTEEIFQEKVLVETIYKSLLDFICSKQAEEVGAETLPTETGAWSGFNTPTKLPLLSGIAETCPDTPLKTRRSAVNIDIGICRRLEF